MLEHREDAASKNDEHDRTHDKTSDIYQHNSNHARSGEQQSNDQGNKSKRQLYEKKDRLHGTSPAFHCFSDSIV